MGVFYPLAGCLKISGLVQGNLAVSKLHLFKDSLGTPDPTVPLADYTANECDFSGYPAGGATVTAFLDPILDPLGGSAINMPTVQFAFDGSDMTPTTNNVGGWYLVDADGDLNAVGTYPVSVPMESGGQGIDVNLKLVQLTGETG
jgi:hypothetical protein